MKTRRADKFSTNHFWGRLEQSPVWWDRGKGTAAFSYTDFKDSYHQRSRLLMNTAFGKQLKMKYCKIFLFLLLMMMSVSTNAQGVTCEGEQLINVEIVVGNPGKAPPYKPGHILVFRCTDVNLKMHGQRTIECLSNGKWDYPYPKCGEVTCLLNTKENNIRLDRFPDFECPVTPGYNLTFSCTGQGLILKGQREITCQSNGEWSSPFPKCEEKHTEEITCELKSNTFGVKKINPKGKTIFRAGESVEITCSEKHWIFFTKESRKTFTCKDDGKWDNEPVCAGQTTSCGPPPDVNDADTIELKKDEYTTGERVEYSCFSKYTLDLRPPFSRFLTCDQGEWRGNIKCLKPCTVTVEEMERRGIDLAYVNRQKMFAPHNDYVTFACKRGKFSVGVPLRQQCNDGVMTLPECK
ncbi:complement factor H like 5 [Carassius auratus]|uniref:Complement factor H like 5 n=1 Tax=Carassius auratus TaxID=7957 RepID=A0A6P6M5K1_CARAU|nr:complement factor H-related protein 1-like [Carassius auratus]